MRWAVFVIITLITLATVAYLTIRDWMRVPKESYQKILRAANQNILLGKWQEAQDLISPLLERGGREVSLLHIQVLRGTGRLKEGLDQAVAWGRRCPEELLFRMEEGLILLEMDQPKEALEAFQVCAPIMRTESDAIAFASSMNRTGHPTQAFEILEPWINTTHNGELLALVGETFFERKLFHEAIHYYQLALKCGYKTHQVFTQYGHAYRRLGNLSEAQKIFRTLLEQDSTDLLATLGLGMCLQERGYFQKALLIYQSSAAWAKKDPRLLKEAGLCALRTKRFLYAENYLEEVIRATEPDPSVLASYAVALENQTKWQEAEQIYLQVVALFPSYPHGYRALAWMFGVGLTKTLSHEQGINFAHIALKLKNDSVSWEILSACEARVGNFERAYSIQMELWKQADSRETRMRRSQALRHLRKHHPLDGHHVMRSLVA